MTTPAFTPFVAPLSTPVTFRGNTFAAVRVVAILSGVPGFANGYRFRPVEDRRAEDAPEPGWADLPGEFFAPHAAPTAPTEANAAADIEAFLAAASVPDLAASKIAMREVAKARRAQLVTSGFMFRDKLIQTRSNVDIGNINSTALAALSAPSLTTDWITADNSTLPLDAAGVIEMQLVMTAAGNAIYAAFLDICAQIETAPDIAALNALKPTVETFEP